MDASAIQQHLAKWKARNEVSNALLAFAALVSAMIVLFFTFWFVYFIAWFAGDGVSAVWYLSFGKRLHFTHTARLIVSGVVLVLLFIQHFRTSPWHWGDYPHRNYPPAYPYAGSGGPLMLLLYPGASANMIADVLLTGPRLTTGAWHLAVKALAIRKLDPVACSSLLSFMLTQNRPVPYEELREAGWEPRLNQMRCLEGIRFLEHGLSLSSDLRKELMS